MISEVNQIERMSSTHFYFWNTIYSQWFTREDLFQDEDGFIYPSAEKYMMMEKAKVFGDEEIYESIKSSYFPNDAKYLGKKIKGFSEEIWDKHKLDIVINASYLKFGQNEDLLGKMFEHKNLILVEASPADKIWGIGLHFEDDRVLDESKWQGENLLGIALMEARKKLIKERKI